MLPLATLKSVKQEYVEPVITDTQVEEAITARAYPAMPPRLHVDRAAKEGDLVNMDFSADLCQSPPKAKKKNSSPKHPIRQSSVIMTCAQKPGHTKISPKNVIGMKAGETKTFTHTYPKDDPVEKLQGQKLEFTVELHTIQELVLPELNDEFVMKIGQFRFCR